MKKKYIVTVLVIAVLALAGAGYLVSKKFLFDKPFRQAVFLTNGQVYFGFIENPNSQIVRVKDIYYLKSDEIAQSEKDKKISLIKMGSELHGPLNYLNVNRDQILFYEDLKSDSKINVAIQNALSQVNKN